MKKLLTLNVNCTAFNEVKSNGYVYRQICFDGTAEGEYFNGKVLPGGVDTQFGNPDGTGILSARYILEGTDFEGNACRIFVQNEGRFDTSVTKPQIHTDSKALEFFDCDKLEGKIRNDENGALKIDIFLND